MADLEADRRLNTGESVELLDAVDANVSDADLRALVENLIESTMPSVDPHRESFGYALLARIGLRKNEGHSFKDRHLDGNMQSVKRMMDGGNLFVARLDGKVAGMAGIRNRGRLSDGRDMYELAKLSVLSSPEFRGKGMSSRLRDYCIRVAGEKYGDVPLVLSTEEDILKASLLRAGFQKITPSRDDERVKLLFDGVDDAEFAQMLADGHEIFVFDPRATVLQ